MHCTILFGTILFPDANTAVIKEIVAAAVVQADTLDELEEMAEQMAKEYNGDWLIPDYFHGDIIEEEGICPSCNGSGEGMQEDSTCRTCKGSGES